MALPEYENLTTEELDRADHMAECGDYSGLRRMQRLSASRGDGEIPNTYSARCIQNNTMPLARRGRRDE